MNRIVSTTALLALLAPVAAYGADLSTKDPVAALIAPSAHNWGGIYFGVNAGGGWSDTRSDVNATGNFAADKDPVFYSATAKGPDIGGFLGGGQVGFNIQRGVIVFGAVADIQGGDVSGGATTRNAPIGWAYDGDSGKTGWETDLRVSQHIGWYGTVRGVVGVSVGNWLPYATGGFAYAGIEDKLSNVATSADDLHYSVKNDRTETGYTVGGGLKYAFSQNWDAGVEFLYVDLGSHPISGSFLLDPKYPQSKINVATGDIDADFYTVKLAVNYRFPVAN